MINVSKRRNEKKWRHPPPRVLCLGGTMESLTGTRQLVRSPTVPEAGQNKGVFLPPPRPGLLRCSNKPLSSHSCYAVAHVLAPTSASWQGLSSIFVVSFSLTRGLSGLGFSFPPATSTKPPIQHTTESSELNQSPCMEKKKKRLFNEAFSVCVGVCTVGFQLDTSANVADCPGLSQVTASPSINLI